MIINQEWTSNLIYEWVRGGMIGYLPAVWKARM